MAEDVKKDDLLDDNTNIDAQEDKSKNDEKPEDKPKLYTDDEVNAILSRKISALKRKMGEDTKREEPENKPKNMDNEDTDKLKEQMAALENELKSMKTANTKTSAVGMIKKAGIRDDRAEAVIKIIGLDNLLNDDGKIDKNLVTAEVKQILKDFPEFKSDNQNNVKFGGGGRKETTPKIDDARLKKIFGLSEPKTDK